MKIKKYPTSAYNCIVFDEILLYSPKQLHLIKSYMEQNSDKQFHYTGDIDQRKPFNFGCNNIENQNKYHLFSLKQMFPYQITLKTNKRLKSCTDKKRLKKLKKDIFDLSQKPINTFKTHGIKIINSMKQVDTTNNICLFNFRCDRVSNHISKNVVKIDGFYEGMDIVCKLHYKTTTIRLYVNYRYMTKTIKDKEVIINEPVEYIDMAITYEISNCHTRI